MMEQLFLILIFFATVVGIVYFLLIGSYCYGWLKTQERDLKNHNPIFVSIIIAARNEENNIIHCLDAILKQSYPTDKFEIIVVDDASTDNTNKLIHEYSEKKSIVKLITLVENEQNCGKKNAIKTGIQKAKGELIITTDADCVMGENWLLSIASFYMETKAKMIVGPVCFRNERNAFEKMQSLEFMALIACGGASLYFHKAIMCNGANLAYSKSVFEEVNGFDALEERASGDDVLLMYKVKEKYREGVKFMKSSEAIVYTHAQPSLAGFIQQRKRWASKGFFLMNMETKVVSLLIYSFSFLLVFLPLTGLLCLRNTGFYPAFMEICLILLGIKCFIDFLLLFLSASFFKKKRLLFYFLPELLIYMLYVVLIGFIGTVGEYQWKGRKIK